MNNCHGTILKISNVNYYRCIYGELIFNPDLVDGDECSNCGRIIKCTNEPIVVKTRTILEEQYQFDYEWITHTWNCLHQVKPVSISKLSSEGGSWLAIARETMIRTSGGDRLTWGSNQQVTMTVVDIELMAASIAANAINEYIEKNPSFKIKK